MIRCSKVYQVGSESVKCVSGETAEDIKHSEYCLKEKKLREKYPSAVKIGWNAEKQIWSISFSESKNSTSKSKADLDIIEEEEEDDYGR